MNLDPIKTTQIFNKSFDFKKNKNISGTTSVTFTSLNFSPVGKKLIRGKKIRIGQKISRFVDESMISVKGVLRKLKRSDELPFTEKPLIAASRKDKIPIIVKDPLKATDLHDKDVLKTAERLMRSTEVPKENCSKLDTKLKNIKLINPTKNGPKLARIGGIDALDKENKAAIAAAQKKYPNFRGNLDNADGISIADSTQINEGGVATNGSDIIQKRSTLGTEVLGKSPDNNLHLHEVNEIEGSDIIQKRSTLGTEILGKSTADNLHLHEVASDGSDIIRERPTFGGEIADKVSAVTDVLNNPVVETVLAEAPLLRWFEPIKNLMQGNVKKAAVGGVTRSGEVALTFFAGPIKWGWSVLGGVFGTISRVAGNKGEGTGFAGGYSEASKIWARGRNHIENKMMGVKEVDPLIRFRQQQEFYEKETQRQVDKIWQRYDRDLAKKEYEHEIEMNKLNGEISQAKKETQEVKGEAAYYKDKSQVAKQHINVELNMISKEMEKLNADNQKLIETHNALINNLSERLAEASKQKNTELQEKLQLQLQKIQKQQKTELDEATKKFRKFAQVSEIYKNAANMSRIKGFGRIAGYQEQKGLLLAHFNSSIALEKVGESVDVPGFVLIYGPHGTGKTTLAESFADQTECNLINLPTVIDSNMNWHNLLNAARTSQKGFEKDRTRSVIVINQLNNFYSNEPEIGLKKLAHGFLPTGKFDINAKLNKFMKECSKKYHCTIVATENFPEKINKELLSDEISYKLSVPPANKENAAAVLKHYVQNSADKDVNYEKLAEQIISFNKDGAFSNSRIKAVVTNLTQSSENIDKKLTQTDLMQSILNKGPDIYKEDLELFDNQIKYIEQISEKRI